MLAPADAELAARDVAVPGLRIVLDPSALSERLARALPDTTFAAVQAEYVRYKPATSCTVGYRLVVDGHDVDAYAKALGGHDRHAHAKVDKTLAKAEAAPPADLGAVDVGDGVVVTFFPNDPQLPGVQRLGDAARRQRLLAAVLPDHQALWEAPLQRLRYKPERRYVARVGTADGPAAVIKCLTAEAFGPARRSARAAGDSPHVATLLGTSSRRAVLAFPWLAGQPLDALLAGAEDGLDGVPLHEVGQALADFHRRRPSRLPMRSPTREAQTLQASARMLSALLPAVGEDAAGLADELAAAVLAGEPMAAMVHGDFSSDQVLVGSATVHVLDLDEVATGDPAADLGRFAAALDVDVLQDRLPAARARAALDGVCDGYRAGGGILQADRLRLHRAMALLRVTPEPFRQRQPCWPARSEQVLRHATAVWAA